MRRLNESTDSRYYAYLPPNGSPVTRNSSSTSVNQNAYYQYYDPRLRSRQQTQYTLNEYQYSSTSPNRSAASLFGSPNHRHAYQPPSLYPNLPPSSTSSIADLGEPLSVFDNIKSPEYRRPLVVPPLPSTYVPPDPSQRVASTAERIVTAQVIREQILTDIEHTMNDIDRELTTLSSLERRPSLGRYMPPRFSPIAELTNPDDNIMRQLKRPTKPISVPVGKSIPALDGIPIDNYNIKNISSSSTRATTTKDKSSGFTQAWPNKPKRVYQVIPSLTNDSRKTSRQSSVGGSNEQIKITDIPSLRSTPKLNEKNLSSGKHGLQSQFHYAAEVDETEILANDPENSDSKLEFDEPKETKFYSQLKTEEFLRDLTPVPQNHATVFVPAFRTNSEMLQNDEPNENIPSYKQHQPKSPQQLKTTTKFYDLNQRDSDQTDNPQPIIMTDSLSATPTHKRIEAPSPALPTFVAPDVSNQHKKVEVNSPQQSMNDYLDDVKSADIISLVEPTSFTPQHPTHKIESEIITSPISRKNALSPRESSYEAELDFNNQENPTVSQFGDHQSRSSTKNLHRSPIITESQRERSPSPPTAAVQSSFIPTNPTINKNLVGHDSYFFSDFSHEGDGEEELMPIDQSNFVVPSYTEILTDDNVSHNPIPLSETTLLISNSERLPKKPDSAKSSTTKNNNKHTEEENEEITNYKTDSAKKRITSATSTLPSSSPSSSPKRILPTSTIDGMQTQFSRKNSSHTEAIDLNIEEQEQSLNNSRIHAHSSKPPSNFQMHSRVQSAKSDKHELQHENDDNNNHYFEENRILSPNTHSPLRDVDNQRTPTPKTVDSANQRLQSVPKALSRSVSMKSNHTKDVDEESRFINSPTKTPLDPFNREISRPNSQIVSHPPSATPGEQSQFSPQRSASLHRLSYDESQYSPLAFNNHANQTPTNVSKPNQFSAENEHFLHHEEQTPIDPDRRIITNYTETRQYNDSRQNSMPTSPVPVALTSPDQANNQHKTSRTTTPQKKHSIASIDLPPDPNILLTTTDDPDPNDPSIIHSTIHLKVLSSKPSDADTPTIDDRGPSPLVNMATREEQPPHISSVELPNDVQQRKAPPTLHRSPSIEAELGPINERPVAEAEHDFIQTFLPSSHEHQELSNRTLTPTTNDFQNNLSNSNPIVSYPERLEDLMRPTPTPVLSTHNNKRQQQENEENGSQPMPTRLKNINIDRNLEQSRQLNFQSSPNNSPLSSPRHSIASDANHASVEGDESNRDQSNTPVASAQSSRLLFYTSNNNQRKTEKLNLITPIKRKPFDKHNSDSTSSEKSNSPTFAKNKQSNEEHLYRNDPQLSSASIRVNKNQPSVSLKSPVQAELNEESSAPQITASQQNSKLSLRVRQSKSKRKNFTDEQQPSSPKFDDTENNDPSNIENGSESKTKQRRRRRVSFSSSIAHFHLEEQRTLTNWRERVAAVLASKHRSNEKYAHVQSRVNSFANFEYQPKKIKIIPVKKNPPKVTEQTSAEEKKFLKRKKYKVKKRKPQPVVTREEHKNEEPHPVQREKEPAPQLFGRLWCLPDGSTTIFHEPLDWNAESKLKSYSFENLSFEPHRSEFKIFNKKPKWNSESKLSDLLKDTPRFLRRQNLLPLNSLPTIADRDQSYYQRHQNLEPGMEKKIFDVHMNNQQGDAKYSPQNFPDDASHRSFGSKPADWPIFNEKLEWTAKSKIKDTTWKNIKYQPRKSKVQIFHKTVHWNSEPKVRTRSPSTIHLSRASMSNVQIFDEKLNWDAQAKVHCWSEIDLRQLTRKKAIFAQYHDPKWHDIVTSRIDSHNYDYAKLQNHVEIFSDRLAWSKDSELKDYVWENYDFKSRPRTLQSNNLKQQDDIDQSPANRPKWNSVGKAGSYNAVYNPRLMNSTIVRRGWDQDLRRKRVHKLPPLKRKRKHDDIPQVSVDVPLPELPSNGQLALDYNYDHTSTTQGRNTSNGYVTMSSRRSSKALVPINHHRPFPDLELPTETPRSQRPVQQEWYEEMNKSRLTHRTDMERLTNRSFRNSIDSIHQPNTPRELATFRSSTRNSQNSLISGTLLDPSVRTNRATEFRLSKDLNEHHQHSHTPSQSMPIEIRGFTLEGTQLSCSDDATIRPLSNVNYGSSERIKTRRVYPWSSLHPHGTPSRNSSLVPIAELRRPSLETTIVEAQQLNNEE